MAPAVAGGVIAYEDLFEVIDQDPDGKKFDKVSRFRCRSQFEAELQIDINVDIYKLEVRSPFPSTRSRPPPPPRSRRRASKPRGTREQRAARSSSLDSALVSLESPSSLTLAPSSPLTPHPSAKVGTKFTLVLAPTLSLNGTPEDTSFDQSGEESLADAYEYVMYGKVFKKEDTDEGGIAKAAVNISFGGLLLHLKAEPKNLQDVEIDNRVYVLIRKIK
jgi:RNA polymerase Rpb8.